jgi:hypothetical protein
MTSPAAANPTDTWARASAQVSALPRWRRWAALAGAPGLRLPWRPRYLLGRILTAAAAAWAVLTIVFTGTNPNITNAAVATPAILESPLIPICTTTA